MAVAPLSETAMRPKVRCLVYLLYVAGVVEIALRIIAPEIPNFVGRFHSDTWYRLELIRSASNSARRSELQSGVFGRGQYHPILGWSLRPGLAEEQVPGRYSVTTNSRGLRGSVEYPYERNPITKRIVAIGDSFTFGDEVSDGESYPAQLATMMPSTEVINSGVNGYGHDQILLSLKHETRKYSPDIIVLGFVESDMSRNLLRMMHYPKPKYEFSSGALKLINIPVPTFAALYDQEVYRSKILDVIRLIQDSVRLKYFSTAYREERNEITARILDEMVQEIREVGAKPVFVYIFTPASIPHMRRTSKLASEDFFHSFCNTRQVKCISTRPYFEGALAMGTQLKQEGHWDVVGNRIIAQAVYETLR